MPEDKKPKRKYDIWFLIILAVIVWSLARQLVDYAFLIPYNLSNISLWARTIATAIAIYGTIWITKIYIRQIKETRNDK